MISEQQTTASPIDKYNIRVTADAIAELVNGRPAVRIPRQDIVGMELRWGITAERPILALLSGLLLMGLASPFLLHVYFWLFSGGTVYGAECYAMSSLILAGAWMIHSAIRKGHFLSVRTALETRKLVFDRNAARADIVGFCDQVARILGCAVQMSVSPND